MAKRWIKAGATDQTIDVFIQDSSSTTGAGLAGLAYNTASLVCYYRKGATGTPTALTLATQTVGGAHADGGFVAVDGTNCPGQYRLDLSDTIVATAGMVTLYLRGATNMAPCLVELEVVSVDIFDTVRLGLTALPNVASGNAGALLTSGTGTAQLSTSSGQVLVQSGTSSGQLSVTSGVVASNVTQFGGTNGVFASGRPEVNTSHWGGSTTPVTNLNTVFNTDFATNYNTTLDLWNVNATKITGDDPLTALAGLVVETSTITNSAISASTFQAGAITSTVIADAALTAAKLSSGTLEERHFATTAGTYYPLQIIDQGTAQSATATTLVLRSAAAFADDEIIGARIVITGGSAGVGQSRLITDYVASSDTATVATWTTTPTGTITYKIFSSTASAGGSAPTAAEIADAVWDEATAGHTTSGTFGEQLKTDVDAILADTNELQTDWVNGGRLDLILDARASQTSVDAIDTVVDTILVDTNELQTDWVNGGRLDLILDARASQVSVDTVDTVVDAIKVATDKLDDTLEDDGGTYRFTANALEEAPTGGSAPTAGEIADAVWDEATAGHTTSGTFGEQLKTDVDAILADTNELQTDWVNGGRLDLILDARASQTSVDTIDGIVDAILLDTAEIGAAGAGLTNINLPDQTMNITGNITGNLSGTVGSVTGNVGGSIGSLAAQAKADVNAEVDTALADIHLDHWLGTAASIPAVVSGTYFDQMLRDGSATYDRTTDSLQAIRDRGDAAWTTGSGGLDAAGIRAALGLGSANLDDQLGTIDTVVDTILVDTNELQTDWVNGGRLDLILDARASQSSVDAIDTVVDTILVDTNELQTDWVNGGRLDLILDSRASQTSVDTIDGVVDAILLDTAEIGAAGVGLTALAQSSIWTAAVAGRIDVATSTRMESYTQPVGFLGATFPATVASPTNITAGTITTVTTVSGLAAGAITNASIADDAISDAKIAVPAETAGRPTRLLAMLRRAWEWQVNKRTRNRSSGVVTLYGADGTTALEAATQSTTGTTDEQTAGA